MIIPENRLGTKIGGSLTGATAVCQSQLQHIAAQLHPKNVFVDNLRAN
jgi:hypothetical protein